MSGSCSQLTVLGLVEVGWCLLPNPMAMARLRAAGLDPHERGVRSGVLAVGFSLEDLVSECTPVKLKRLVNVLTARWALGQALAVEMGLVGVTRWREGGRFAFRN